MLTAGFEISGVIPNQGLRVEGFVEPLFRDIRIPLNIGKMAAYVVLRHYKTVVSDAVEIKLLEIAVPAGGDITALDGQILFVFDRGFDDFPG